MDILFASAMVLALASVVCLFAWLGKPAITSNALLVRAEVWDTIASNSSTGIVVQRVSIKTPKQQLSRAIYRDVHGMRREKNARLSQEDETLRDTLATVGVKWDSPLSAGDYQDWHDHQRVRQDEIKRSGKTLVLTTTVPDGLVAVQSFTVRDSDFHPIERKVTLRDSGTIEIAELEYETMPWSQVDADLLEPVPVSVLEPMRADAPVKLQLSVVPRIPVQATDEQLDEAELSARLVLNETHADTGEQIKIERQPQKIEVKGLVETDQRKAELQTKLRTIPYLSVAILSMGELSRQQDPDAGMLSEQLISGAAKASPLETYFLSQKRSTSSLSDFSQRMLDSSLTVVRESRAIAELLSRFGTAQKMTDLAFASLSDLVFSHRQRLLVALGQEHDLIKTTGIIFEPKLSLVPLNDSTSLIAVAEKNLTLSKELTLGGSNVPRSADAILADMDASIEEVRVKAHSAKLVRLNPPVLAGGK